MLSASTGSPTTRYSSVRLQVEIATASWTSAAPRRSRTNSSARGVGQREPLADLDRRGLVRDADREQLAHADVLQVALAPSARTRLDVLLELGELALRVAEPRSP